MFKGKPLGLLTLQLPRIQPPDIPQQVDQYISNLEVSIPLLEGGLFYHGAFSGIADASVSDLFLFVDNRLIKTVDFEKTSTGEARPASYQVRIGQIVSSNYPDAQPKQQTVLLHEHPDDPQQFFGSLTQDGTQVKFIYKDISEPITIGIVAVIGLGVGGVLCGANLIIGYIETKKCEKKKISTRFGFSKGSLQIPFPSIDCEVTCL